MRAFRRTEPNSLLFTLYFSLFSLSLSSLLFLQQPLMLRLLLAVVTALA